nr:hypothetical protein [Parabacteroides goldsteinii]
MKAADLYQLIENPSLLTKETLPQLKQIVDEYPYFHIARMLYLKNLAVLNDMRFAAELRKMAVYIPDRKKLFTLIEGERYGMHLKTASGEEAETADAFSLIEAFLADREGEGEQQASDPTLLFQPSVSSDYIYWSLTKDSETQEEEESSVKLQHHDLIDSFIKNDEQRAPGSGLGINLEPGEEGQSSSLKPEEEEQARSLDDDSYFTETLAHIYVKQKRYEKALQIIKNLYLNYPEKNAYFADQIRFLEKLIINTKK